MAGVVLSGIGKGLSVATDAAASVGEVLYDEIEGGASALGEGVESVGGNIGAAFTARRTRTVNLNHKVAVFPQWLVYAFSAAGIVAFLAKFGRTLCCCYWPLECCVGAFARVWNWLRPLACPCTNEFRFLTISIDRILVIQTSRSIGGRQNQPRDLEVGVSFGYVWPFGAFSSTQVLEAGWQLQPKELEAQDLGGGEVFFEARCGDLPKGRDLFQKKSVAFSLGGGSEWVARSWFRRKHGLLVQSGWSLKGIKAYQAGKWTSQYSQGEGEEEPTLVNPNDRLADLCTIRGRKEVMKLQFLGRQEGGVEWPRVCEDPADAGPCREEAAMSLTYRGTEEDLVLVLQVFLERSAVETSRDIRERAGDTGGRSLAQRLWRDLGRGFRTVRNTVESTAEDIEEAVLGGMREVNFLRWMLPEEPDPDYKMERCIMVEIRPCHLEAGSFEHRFEGFNELLHVYAETSANRIFGAITVHLSRLRVEVALGKGPLKGKVKVTGFVVPRVALLKKNNPHHMDVMQDTGRTDIYHGSNVKDRLQFTVPVRPTDTDIWLRVRPKPSFAENVSSALGRVPLVGSGLSWTVDWIAGTDKKPDELFSGEMHIEIGPQQTGNSVTYGVVGQPPVRLSPEDLAPPGTVQQLVDVSAPPVVDSRCSYLLWFRLVSTDRMPALAQSYVFPRSTPGHVVFGWALFLVFSTTTLIGLLTQVVEGHLLILDGTKGCDPFFNKNMTTSTGTIFTAEGCAKHLDLTVEPCLGLALLCYGFLHLAMLLGLCTRLCGLAPQRVANRVVAVIYLVVTVPMLAAACIPAGYGSTNLKQDLHDPYILGRWHEYRSWVAKIIFGTRLLATGEMWNYMNWINKTMLVGFLVVPMLVTFQNIEDLVGCIERMRERDGEGTEDSERFTLKLPEALARSLGLRVVASKVRPQAGAPSCLERLLPGKTHGRSSHASLAVIVKHGFTAWEDEDEESYLSELVHVVGACTKCYLKLREFEASLRGLWGVGKHVPPTAHSTNRLFQALCNLPAGERGKDDVSDTEEQTKIQDIWGEERLYLESFAANWSFTGTGQAPEVVAFREALASSSSLTLEEQVAHAWGCLQECGPVPELVSRWKHFTPAAACKAFQLQVSVAGDPGILAKCFLHVDVRVRYLGRDVGHLCATAPCFEARAPKADEAAGCALLWGPVGGRRACSWPKTIPLDAKKAESRFDEYCVVFCLEPDPELVEGEELPADWPLRFAAGLKDMTVGWNLLGDGQCLEPAWYHPLPGELPEGVPPESTEWMWDHHSISAALESTARIVLSAKTMATYSCLKEQQPQLREGYSRSWWPVSQFRILTHVLCDKYEHHPHDGILAADLVDILESFHEQSSKSEWQELEVSRYVDFCVSISDLQGRPGAPSPFERIFDRDMGWKCREVLHPRRGTQDFGGEGEKDALVFQAYLPSPRGMAPSAPGWALEKMELDGAFAFQAWSAHDGKDPLQWLDLAAEWRRKDSDVPLVRLLGRRRVYMDMHGQVLELNHATGQIMDGVAAARESTRGMSKMELDNMLRVIQERQGAVEKKEALGTPAEQHRLVVPLKTLSDVSALEQAVNGKGPKLVMISDEGVLPRSAVFESFSSPKLAFAISDLTEVLEKLNAKEGMELFPATATLRLTHERLLDVPFDLELLSLHLLVLARVHGFDPSKADARAALMVLASAHKEQAQKTAMRKALVCVAKGAPPPLDLACRAGRNEYTLEYVEPVGFVQHLLHRQTYMCNNCAYTIPDTEYRYVCDPCHIVLCVACGGRIQELKDEILNLRWLVLQDMEPTEDEVSTWVKEAFDEVDLPLPPEPSAPNSQPLLPKSWSLAELISSIRFNKPKVETCLRTLLPIRRGVPRANSCESEASAPAAVRCGCGPRTLRTAR